MLLPRTDLEMNFLMITFRANPGMDHKNRTGKIESFCLLIIIIIIIKNRASMLYRKNYSKYKSVLESFIYSG